MKFKHTLITLLIVVTVVFMPFVSGCQQPLTGQQIKNAAIEVNDLNVQMAAIKEASYQMAQASKDSNLIDANTLAKITKLNSETDKVQAKIKILTTALTNVQTTGDNNQDLLLLLQQLNAASAPFNPYAAPTAGALAIISLILTAIANDQAKKKAKAQAEASQNQKSLDEVVTGNEIFMNNSTPEVGQNFKNIQNQTQTAETSKKVAAIKAS